MKLCAEDTQVQYMLHQLYPLNTLAVC